MSQAGVRHSKLRNFLPSFLKPPLEEAKPQEKQQPRRQRLRKPITKQETTTQPKKPPPPKAYKKQKIPAALREACWIKTMGRSFEGKCPVEWCPNTITVFDFQAGHNIPESKGGTTTLPNLIAICSRCNFSMGNSYTITEWNTIHKSTPTPSPPPPPKRSWIQRWVCCLQRK